MDSKAGISVQRLLSEHIGSVQFLISPPVPPSSSMCWCFRSCRKQPSRKPGLRRKARSTTSCLLKPNHPFIQIIYIYISLSLSLSSPSSFIDSLLQEHVKVKVRMSAFIFKKRGDNLSLVQPTPIIKPNLVFVVINDYIYHIYIYYFIIFFNLEATFEAIPFPRPLLQPPQGSPLHESTMGCSVSVNKPRHTSSLTRRLRSPTQRYPKNT